MRNRAAMSLKRPKFRMSMNKVNLYNLSRVILPAYKTRTFFQQKWSAKSLMRTYHGEQVREGQWTRMFSRRLRSVRDKGSRRAKASESDSEVEPTPFMNMTFAPLERRLDVAVFRALFASSVRQARQFVVHGKVKVNGQVMRYSAYLLNPGDMFQVDPDHVMLAMGEKKIPGQGISTRAAQRQYSLEHQDELAAKIAHGQKQRADRLRERGQRRRNRIPTESRLCTNCGENGHFWDQCSSPLKCTICAQDGHDASSCAESGKSTPLADKIRGALAQRRRETIDQWRQSLPAEQRLCTNCGQRGHLWEQCSNPAVCSFCKDEGHNQAGCAKQLALAGGITDTTDPAQIKETLKALQAQAKDVLSSQHDTLPAKQKQNLRTFKRTIRQLLSQAGKDSLLTDSLEAQFQELTHRLKIEKQSSQQGPSSDKADATGAEAAAKVVDPNANILPVDQFNELHRAVMTSRIVTPKPAEAPKQEPWFQVPNEKDLSKPYLTPWQPRAYLSAFAFIPRYLEVNQNACAAVYLRHPVARPGSAEVPTPYPEMVNAAAFAWYLRRR
ncbi:hypothetical protein DV736_g5656, partial [Chaetothyriales sp. CBS 134916]